MKHWSNEVLTAPHAVILEETSLALETNLKLKCLASVRKDSSK